MRILLLATLLSATSSAAAVPEPNPGEAAAAGVRAIPAPPRASLCKDRMQVIPAETATRPEANRLGDLPPGDTILAVYRESEDGCIDPVIVRYGDGRRAPAAVAPEPVRPRARLYR